MYIARCTAVEVFVLAYGFIFDEFFSDEHIWFPIFSDSCPDGFIFVQLLSSFSLVLDGYFQSSKKYLELPQRIAKLFVGSNG